MANYLGILGVSDALQGILRSSYRPQDLGDTPLRFEVFTSRDFASNPIDNGISLFLYRIFVNGANRIPPGRIGPTGVRQRPQLPLELHYLVTIWAQQHTLQHSLAAWTMRTLEDNSFLPAGVLNAGGRQIFRPDEAVELAPAEMRTEDLFEIWQILGASSYHLSIPYLARVVSLESIDWQAESDGEPVQERVFQYSDPGRIRPVSS